MPGVGRVRLEFLNDVAKVAPLGRIHGTET